jgi:hypothetical protein
MGQYVQPAAYVVAIAASMYLVAHVSWQTFKQRKK